MRPELYHKTTLASETERMLKFVLNKAGPIICNLAVGSESCQFGKRSNRVVLDPVRGPVHPSYVRNFSF